MQCPITQHLQRDPRSKTPHGRSSEAVIHGIFANMPETECWRSEALLPADARRGARFVKAHLMFWAAHGLWGKQVFDGIVLRLRG
jgi:hypothetical protein